MKLIAPVRMFQSCGSSSTAAQETADGGYPQLVRHEQTCRRVPSLGHALKLDEPEWHAPRAKCSRHCAKGKSSGSAAGLAASAQGGTANEASAALHAALHP